LAVVRIPLPPLRQRREDIPALVAELLEQMRTPPEARARLLAPQFLDKLQLLPWPGNVRELRNYLERCLVLDESVVPGGAPVPDTAFLPFAEASKLAQASFERAYLEALLEHTHGKVAAAAQLAQVNRVSLYRMLRRHGLKPG